MQSHYSWMPVPEQSTCSDLSLIALCVVYYVHWCDCMLMWGLLGKECSSWKAKLGKGRALTHDDYGSMAWHPFIEYGNCSPRFSWNLSYCGTQRWLANHTLFKFLTSVHIDADSKEWQRDIIKQATCWVGCIELRPSCTAQLTLSHSIHLHGSQKMHAVITLFLRVLPSFQPRHVPKSWEEPRNKTTAPDSSYVCVMSACIYSNSLVPRPSSKEERNVWGMSLRGVWVRG